MKDGLLLGVTTCETVEDAERLAFQMIDQGISVCVQIEENVRSIYRFEGDRKDHSEVRILVKFSSQKASTLEAFIEANHPYEVPEWVVLRPESVSARYLSWALA